MKKILKVGICALTIALSANTLAAEMGSGQINAKVSTMGFGIEYSHPINAVLSVSLGANKLNLNVNLTKGDTNYNIKADLQSASVIANYHPWENSFRLRAGTYYNNNKVSLNITNKELNGVNATLGGEVSFKKFAPYVGIGYGSEPIGDNNFSFDFDIGVMHSPIKVQLTDTCTIPELCDGLREKQQDITTKLKDYNLYPIISLGLSYRF